MGFLGQELPGSIICAECTCSHMPEPERSRAYLRPHAFPHPPPAPGPLPTEPPSTCLPRNGVQKRPESLPVQPRWRAAGPAGVPRSVPALPASPRVVLGRCPRSCPQAGDAEHSSSLLEMGSAGTQPWLLSPEHAPVAQLEMCGFFGALIPLQLRPSHPPFCQVFFQTSSEAPEEQGLLGEPLLPGPSTSSAGQPHFPRLLLPAGSFPPPPSSNCFPWCPETWETRPHLKSLR